MRLLLTLFAALLMLGCQTVPPSYQVLTERLEAGRSVDPRDLRAAFFAADDLGERMERLMDLEQQALAIVEDEPLKLGSIGTAILDTYYGSLTGHYVLARFYEHVDTPSAAAPHREWVARISEAIEDEGDGGRDRPFPVVTAAEARGYAVSKDWSPVGSIYQTDSDVPFSLLLQVATDTGEMKTWNFDLTGMYDSLRQQFGDAAGQDFTPFTLIGFLARQNDSAAQTAVGAFLATQNRFEDSINWLHAASRTGNLLANSILARIYWEQARQADDDATREQALAEVMENYLHAVALGSSDAMYALGVLYLNGHFGDSNRISGVPLLKQAADLGHSDAAVFLAHLHYAGESVERDLDAARRYYASACGLDNALACRAYARFLLDRETDQRGDPEVLERLESQARAEPEDDEAADPAESMLLLGNLHARGIGTEASSGRALRWYKRAVRSAPDDPNVVNEVAWTLAVTDRPDLRRERYARSIMDHLMESEPAARERPEYLDTWAASYAATGDFERAVELQQQAVAAAEADEQAEVLDVLREHLEQFRAGEVVTESVP